MTDYQAFLQRLNQNLNLLREREAKYGGNAPLDLLNQIDDHRQAITLTEQALASEITELEWLTELQPLLISRSDWLGVNLAVQLVLEQYALDHGESLAQLTGPTATETAGEIIDVTAETLRQSPKGEWLVAEFEQDPATYQKPVEKELSAALETNTALVEQFKTLLEQYHQALQSHHEQTGGDVKIKGDNATVIQQGQQSQTIIGSTINGDVLGPGASKK